MNLQFFAESGSNTSRRTALNNIKQDLRLNANESPISQNMVMLRKADGEPIIENGKIIYSREMTYDVRGKNIKNERNEVIDYVVIQDHSYGHKYANGRGNQPSHFNVRLSGIGHAALDVLGMIPFFEFFDAINAAWYYKEGDFANGTLSMVAVTPFIGSAATTGVKWGIKAGSKVTKIAETVKLGSKISAKGKSFIIYGG